MGKVGLPMKAASEALFEHLHHGRGSPAVRLRHQEMEVLRHDHIAEDHKPVSLSNLLQYFQEEVAS